MTAPSKLDFNVAVRECLANCYETDIPISALAEYVDRLKQRDWTPSEIHQVEAAVTKILLAVRSENERDYLVTTIIKPRADSPQASSSDGTAGIPWAAALDNNVRTNNQGLASSSISE